MNSYLNKSKFASPAPHRPLCTGHRGFKALYPENTILSFRKAIEAGATIIETDVQVAGDGVIVISHDPNTERCFGVDHDITTTPYFGVLDKLKAIDTPASKSEPHRQHMPLFKEILQLFVNDPQFENIQLMLDIKRTNEPWIIPKILDDLKAVNPDLDFWAKRMVLGIWKWDVLQAANKTCPTLPVLHIGFSRSLARKFLNQNQVVGISLNVVTLNVPGGHSLIHEAKSLGKLVYSWTVNTKAAMKWAMCTDLDGVITDHPDIYSDSLKKTTQNDIDTVYSIKDPSTFYTFKEKFDYNLKFLIMWCWVYYIQLSEYLSPSRKTPY